VAASDLMALQKQAKLAGKNLPPGADSCNQLHDFKA
jgi:hypothetical protein